MNVTSKAHSDSGLRTTVGRTGMCWSRGELPEADAEKMPHLRHWPLSWPVHVTCRSPCDLETHDPDALVAGTGGGFETLLIEDRDRTASVADQFPAL
jgi:hypothetical protein